MLIVTPTLVGAASPANKELATNLFWELGATDVDTAGQKIQQQDARIRVALAQCFANLRDVMQRAVENDIEAQRRVPASMKRHPSNLAPLALAAQLAHEFATSTPNVQNSLSYRSMIQMQMWRRQSEELLKIPQFQEMFRAMGMDIAALKQWGDEETKRNIRDSYYTWSANIGAQRTWMCKKFFACAPLSHKPSFSRGDPGERFS